MCGFFNRWYKCIDPELDIKIYRGSFERIYIFSPSVHVDNTWTALKKYISDVMKVDAAKEQLYYEEYDPVALKKIIETQHKVIDFQKKNKQKDLFSILLVVDDFADDPKFVRYLSLLRDCSGEVVIMLSRAFYPRRSIMYWPQSLGSMPVLYSSSDSRI